MTSTVSYVTPWVDGTRASRVPTPRRALAGLARVVEYGALSGPLTARPLGHVEHVLVAPDGEHVVVRGADSAWIFDVQGRHVGSVPRGTAAGMTFVTRSGVFHALEDYDWTGKRGALEIAVLIGEPARIWATHIDADDKVSVIDQQPMVGNHGDRWPAQVVVAASRLVPGPLAARLIGADVLKDTYGLGAISHDGEIAILTTAGDLRVYLPHADATMLMKLVHSSHVPFAPYDVAVVDGAVAALEAVGVPAMNESDWRCPYQPFVDLFRCYPAIGKHWTTRVHVVSLRGVPVAQTSVPFEVLQPPIDGGGGRMYLAGNGIAAVEAGKVVWSHGPAAPALATAFENGDLAVVTARELRLIDRDGNIRQSFTVPPDESIVTPPSIAADGAVWLATEKGLYAAR